MRPNTFEVLPLKHGLLTLTPNAYRPLAEEITSCFRFSHGVVKPMVSRGATREKLRGFANEEYKQEAFNPVCGALVTMAIQKYSAVFSVRNKLLRSNEIDLKKPKLREAMTFFLFRSIQRVLRRYLRRISFFIQPDFQIFKDFQVPNRACILAIK